MKPLNSLVLAAEFSGIRKMFNLALGVKDAVKFTVGEPDFSAAPRVVEAANKCTSSGNTKYTPNAGILPLREMIAKDLTKNNVQYDPEKEIIVTVGGMEALYSVFTVLSNPGDEIIVADPYWTNHPTQVHLTGAIPRMVTVKEENGFVYDPADVEKAINSKTKAILINSPANPTGGVASESVLKALSEIAIKHDLWVITDEVYQKFIYDGLKHVSIASFPGMKERTIIINSFSKTYAMTGWRIGYAAGPFDVINQMVKIHEDTTSCVSSAAQYGAIAALEGPEEELQEMCALYDRRRHLIVEGLNSIPGISCIWPKGAFYAFPNITKTGMTSEEFAISLLNEQGVVLVPGNAFGKSGEGFLRISYATSEDQIKKGVDRMAKFMKSKV